MTQTKIIGIRFKIEDIEKIRKLAKSDNRSMSDWLRLIILKELRKVK